jgi:type IV secretion system protein VirB6
MTIFADIQTRVLQPFEQFADRVAGALAGELGPALTAAMTVYIAWYGWLIVRGSVSEPIGEFTVRAMKCCVIAMLVLNAGTYKNLIADPFAKEIPDGISRLFSGATTPDASTFDAAFKDLKLASEKLWIGTGITSPGKSFRALVGTLMLLIAGGGALAFGFISLVWAKAGLWLVLALGPIFIAFALFDSTRGYAQAFGNTCVTLVLQQALIAAVVGLMLDTLKAAMTREDLSGVFDVTVVSIFAIIMWARIPQLASLLGSYGLTMVMNRPMASLGQGVQAASGVRRWLNGTPSTAAPSRSLSASPATPDHVRAAALASQVGGGRPNP